MSLPTFEQAMAGFSIAGLTPGEALKTRRLDWTWEQGAKLLAPYLDGIDLAACCLVSKEFNDVFSPILWSNPIAIIKDKETPFYKIYQLMYLAHSARHKMRSLVKTLDFRYVDNFRILDLEEDSTEQLCADVVWNSAWFMYCSKFFPDIRFAIIDAYPYTTFTRAADPLRIMTGRFQSTKSSSKEVSKSDSLTIRSEEKQDVRVKPEKMTPLLFSASHCGIVGRWELISEIVTSKLMYLDLSYTVKDTASIAAIPQLQFPQLRVLKLRGLRMVDSEFIRLTLLGPKLWSLDVSENNLTDGILQELVLRFTLDCINPYTDNLPQLPDQDLFDDVPEYQRDEVGERRDYTAPLRPDDASAFINYMEKTSGTSSTHDQILDIHDPLLRITGLTHLYISHNKLSSRGVKFLLSVTNRLQVLDVGSVEATITSHTSDLYIPYTKSYAQLDSDSSWGLSRESRSRMQNLRIHHSLVTHVPTIISAGARNRGWTLPLVEEAEAFALCHMQDLRTTPQYQAFSPLQNYRLTELTLTGIPTKSYGFTIEKLIGLLVDCRIQEEKLAEARAWTKKSRRSPELLPGLRSLHFEFIPEDNTPQSPGGGSVSGDRDADTFLASSEGDFSFFSDPNTMSSVSRPGSVPNTGTDTGTGTAAAGSSSRAETRRYGSIFLSEQVASLLADRRSRWSLGRIAAAARSGSSPAVPVSASASASAPPPPQPPPYHAAVKDVAEELKKFRARKEGKWTGGLELILPDAR